MLINKIILEAKKSFVMKMYMMTHVHVKFTFLSRNVITEIYQQPTTNNGMSERQQSLNKAFCLNTVRFPGSTCKFSKDVKLT